MTMSEFLTAASEQAIVVINGLALLIIVVGTVKAFFAAVRLIARPDHHRQPGEVWLEFGRWLVAGLTFQLAADIVETSITTRWEALGRLAAVAAIRTFLNFFLERDMADVRERFETGEGDMSEFVPSRIKPLKPIA
jgi:uncharacterized membrane protein